MANFHEIAQAVVELHQNIHGYVDSQSIDDPNWTYFSELEEIALDSRYHAEHDNSVALYADLLDISLAVDELNVELESGTLAHFGERANELRVELRPILGICL